VNRALADDTRQHNATLILFVTGEAPRSRRAHHNLTAALEDTGIDDAPTREIDLLREPQEAINFGIFATPALMHIEASGKRRVLYGDLSDEHSLNEFLSAL
jgi:circadian clock protein KaiB